MGDNMMDAILDQALDDLENIETGATEEEQEEEEISSDAISNDPTEAEKSQRSDTQGQRQLDGQAEEPLDPKDFFKFLIEGGDDDLGEEVREAKLDEFMKNIQSKLQREVDDSSDSGAKKSSKDKAGRDEDDDDDEVAATLASILEQMTTIEKDDSFAPEGDFAAGNFNPDDIVDGMMEQLLSKDLMYEPMKQVADRYPAWLAANQDSLAETELEKYRKQFNCFKELVHQYETDPGDMNLLMKLMQEVQEFGQPPQDIINEIAPGLELDDDGMPKMNPLEALGAGGDGECALM